VRSSTLRAIQPFGGLGGVFCRTSRSTPAGPDSSESAGVRRYRDRHGRQVIGRTGHFFLAKICHSYGSRNRNEPARAEPLHLHDERQDHRPSIQPLVEEPLERSADGLLHFVSGRRPATPDSECPGPPKSPRGLPGEAVGARPRAGSLAKTRSGPATTAPLVG